MDEKTEREMETEIEILSIMIKLHVDDPKLRNRMLDGLNTIYHLAKGNI